MRAMVQQIGVNNGHFNENKNPFLTSDNPVVRYNSLMEKFAWEFGSYTGNGWIGVKIIIPLNYKYSLIFYDATTYKIGNNKEKFVGLLMSMCEEYDVIIYVSPEGVNIENNGVRTTDSDYRELIDQTIQLMLDEYKPKKLISVKGTTEERIETILQNI